MKTLIQKIASFAILVFFCQSVFGQTNPLDTASPCYKHVQDYLDNKIGTITTEQLEQYNFCLKMANLNEFPLPNNGNRDGSCVGVNEIDVSLYADINEDVFTGNIQGYFFNQVSKTVTIYKTIKLKFDVSNFHSTFSSNIEIDFDGNNQFVPLTSEMSHTFNDNPSGNETRLISIRTPAGLGWFYTKLQITFIKEAKDAYDAPDAIWDIVGNPFTPVVSCGASNFAPEDLKSVTATGRAYIKYGNVDKKMRKPLIFVEGLDLGTEHLCSTLPNEGILRNGSFGWDNFMAGKWEHDGEQPIENMPVLYQNFLAEGYDVILIDFTDGAGWIQANGEVLINLIKKINAIKEGCNHNIVIGASMGGQLSRWALTTMEKRKIIHDAGLYCSFDSPQQGANIPLSLQAFLYFGSKYGANPSKAAKEKWDKLNRPAPQQLIKFHLNTMLDGNECVRKDYENMMSNLGYPIQSMNIATALGAGNMANQGYGNNDPIFYAKYSVANGVLNPFKVELFASGGRDDYYIAHLRIPSKFGNFSGLPIEYHEANLTKLYIGNGNERKIKFEVDQYEIGPNNPVFSKHLESKEGLFTSSFENWDMAPGCSRNDFVDLEPEIKAADKNIDVSVNKKFFTFMPTVSALDIATNDLFYNVISNIKTTEETDPTLTPFKYVYYEATANKAHVEITSGLMAWMKDILLKYELYSGQINPSNPLNKRFNYASESQSHISGTQIIQNGTLVVNGEGKAAYGSIENSNLDVIEKWVYGCSNQVQIKEGGKFVFGEGTQRQGIVHVGAGASVTLDGGLLNLNNEKSALIIEDGGKLILNYGTINLSHPESKIVIKKGGQLIFNGTFSFTGPGYFDFESGHILTLNAPFDLTGIGKYNRFIQLEQSAKLDIANKKIKLRSGAIVYKANTAIKIGNSGRGDFGDNNFTGDNVSATGIDADGSSLLLVDHSDFGGLICGIKATNLSNAVDLNKVSYCNFHSNTKGINLVDNSKSGMRINYSVFSGDKAIDAERTNIITVKECQILARGNVFNEIGVQLDNVNYYNMIGGLVSRYSVGISATRFANISMMSKARIEYCSYGIDINGNQRDETKHVGYLRMNCSELVDNFTGVKGSDVVLYIDNGAKATGNGANVFQTPSDDNTKVFDICYYQRDINSINARGNYWNTHNSLPGKTPSPFAYNIRNRSCSEDVSLVTAPLIAQYPTLQSCNSTTTTGNPGDPVLATPYDRFSVDNCTECLLYKNGLQYALHQQFGTALESFDNEQFETSEQQFAPLAAISSAERDLMSTNCKLYIDIAKCMTYVPSNSIGARSETENWVSGAVKADGQRENGFTVFPNPTINNFTVSMKLGNSNFDLKVKNILGQVMLNEENITGATKMIPTNNWESGIYSVEVKDNITGKTMTNKVVVLKQ